MTHDMENLLAQSGVARIRDLTPWVGERSVRNWLAQGRLVRLHPGVVALSDRSHDWLVRAHAALLHTGGVLSHTTALALWGAITERPTVLHVCVPVGRGIRNGPWLAVHRSTADERPYDINGLRVTNVDSALVDSWGYLNRRAAQPGSVELARSAVISAVRSGRTTPARLASRVATRTNLTGRSELSNLLDLVAGGCQSELEIWGVHQVLRVDGLPPPRQQYRVDLPGGPVYLDAAHPEVQLGIELDGAAFHGDRRARERDIARDAALAAAGWLILRFSYRRLTADPGGCQRDIAAAYRSRSTR